MTVSDELYLHDIRALEARLAESHAAIEEFRRWVQDHCALLEPSRYVAAKGNIFTAFNSRSPPEGR